MPLPKSLITIATLGTDNQSADRSIYESGVDYLGYHPQSVAFQREILAIMAGQYLREKAGWHPPLCDEALPPKSKYEGQPFCTNAASDFLIKLLKDRTADQSLLTEWFFEVEKRGQRIPSEWLPIVMHYRNHNEVDSHHSAFGQRYDWFVEQRYQPSDCFWENFSVQERAVAIEHLRKSHPKRARELTIKMWPFEDSTSRNALLKSFQIGLNADDEDFLVSILNDESTRYVRMAVRNLLVQLPQFAYRQQMERLAKLVFYLTTVDAKPLLMVQDFRFLHRWKSEWTVDPHLWNDSILKYDDSPIPVWATCLSHLPIQFWLNHWKIDNQAFFDAIRNNKPLSPMVWEALLESVQRFNDVEGADALYTSAHHALLPDSIRRLAQCMSPERNESAAIEHLNKHRKPIHLHHPAVWHLFEIPLVWSEQLVHAIFNSVKQQGNLSEHEFDSRLTEAILHLIASRIPLSSSTEYLEIFQQAALFNESTVRIHNDLKRLIDTRTELHTAIDSSA